MANAIDVKVDVEFQEEVVLKTLRKRMKKGSDEAMKEIEQHIIDEITRGDDTASEPHEPWKAHSAVMLEHLQWRSVTVAEGPEHMAVIGQIGFQTKLAYILEQGTEDMAPRPLLQQITVERKKTIWMAWKKGAI